MTRRLDLQDVLPMSNTMKELLAAFDAKGGNFAGLREEPGATVAARLLHTLETRRRALGMTKAQLAEALDVAPSRVTEWTTGEVTPGLVAVGKWAHALGLTLDLTGGDAGAAA